VLTVCQYLLVLVIARMLRNKALSCLPMILLNQSLNVCLLCADASLALSVLLICISSLLVCSGVEFAKQDFV